MPEWYLGIAALIVLGALGMLWKPMLLCLALAAVAAVATLVRAAREAARAPFPSVGRAARIRRRATTALLILIQPAARLCGRVSCGLTPWRRQMPRPLALPVPRRRLIWSENWQAPVDRLRAIEDLLKDRRVPTRRGGAYDDWDLEIRGGFFACVRTRLGVEEYPQGRQYLRFRAWPCFSKPACLAVAALLAALAACAALQHPSGLPFVLGAVAGLLILRALGDCSAAMSCLMTILRHYDESIRRESIHKVPATDNPLSESRRRRPDHRAAESATVLESKIMPDSSTRRDAAPPGARDMDLGLASVVGPPDTLSVHARRSPGEPAESVAWAPEGAAAGQPVK